MGGELRVREFSGDRDEVPQQRGRPCLPPREVGNALHDPRRPQRPVRDTVDAQALR